VTPPASEAERLLREEFPVVVEFPVAWADMDYFRHVNHAVFFTYFEGARIRYLDLIGFREISPESPIGPILASTEARYRRPVTYPDTVVVGARSDELGVDRFRHVYRLVSRRLATIAAEGAGLLVSYDYDSARRVPLPDAVRDRIHRLEGWGSP
jgi:acyl-CoA thioester hydrolase